MAKTLEALLRLQSVEHQICDVRRRLASRRAAVAAQADRIARLESDLAAQHDQYMDRQKSAGAVELELRTREQEVDKLRTSLNTAKTNKEYAAILTRMNTLKADNSKYEDQGLALIQAAEEAHGRMGEIQQQIEEARVQTERVRQESAESIARLEGMLSELEDKRRAATSGVPPKELVVFDRIAAKRGGDAMAKIEVLGDKPPHQYVCSGCNMSLRAEHANALRTRDEVRLCDSCQRILYLEDMIPANHT
ncbi:MAG TPA: C4-type zinc ribbon domain-containing protein [Phycisphaerae bacterium]|nr:C4-type zinc ribbon domain-containing protein [Phycisphaerae bacterium]